MDLRTNNDCFPTQYLLIIHTDTNFPSNTYLRSLFFQTPHVSIENDRHHAFV